MTDAPLTVWRGSYRFGRSDSFFERIVKFAQESADKGEDSRPPQADFYEELERLRAIAPVNGRGLLDQIEYRWRKPTCLPALYALTLRLKAPPGGFLVAESGEHVRELACIKVGEAMHSAAARITRYNTEPLNRLYPVEGSQILRVLIHGDDATMLCEGAIKDVARHNGSYALVIRRKGSDAQKVSPEVFIGARVIDAICAFARAHGEARMLS